MNHTVFSHASNVVHLDDPTQPHPSAPGLSTSTGSRRSFFKKPIATGIALAIVALASLLVWHYAHRSLPLTPIRTIAVLPLANVSGDPSQDYLAEGQTAGLTTELGRVSALRVTSRQSAQVFHNSSKPLPEIARALGVDGLIEGSVRRDQNQVQTVVRLMDGTTGQQIWTESYHGDVGDLLHIQADMAHAIVDQVGVQLTSSEKAYFSKRHRVHPDAVNLYLEGLHRMKFDGELHNAIEFFRGSISKDPYFAPAHAALSNCYGRLGEWGWMNYTEAFANQKQEALKAIELDDSSAEPHVSMSLAAQSEWDWATARRELDRALAIAPNSADVHRALSSYYTRIGLTNRAVDEAKMAASIDPLSSDSDNSLEWAYYFNREYDRARAQVQRSLDERREKMPSLFLLGDIDAEKGNYELAIREFEGNGDRPHSLGHLGNAYARSSRPELALRIVEKLEQHVKVSGLGRYEIALVYAGLRQNDKAFEWLGKAYQARDKGVTYILIDPCIDPLRGDPRLKELARKIGFPDN